MVSYTLTGFERRIKPLHGDIGQLGADPHNIADANIVAGILTEMVDILDDIVAWVAELQEHAENDVAQKPQPFEPILDASAVELRYVVYADRSFVGFCG
jgi:hypothetical protein